ncbi:ribosome maturation factor RimM [Henriciella litoralis]|uniref:ribosome maturation factor RimM n=1 Tax=Henriciella litoralis TaxID=568102 RepID=UPI0009FCD797|nr:ribosome maturation factor RimM [Henriciella litoralis]
MANTKQHDQRLIVVGVILGAHGVRGDVRVKSFTEDPEALFELGPLLSDKSAEILEPRKARPGNDHFIVTPSKTRQKEEWDSLKGTLLHVPRNMLPPPDDDEFYVEDLIGLNAIDAQGARIGAVKTVMNFGAGDLVEITPVDTSAASYFVPFTLADVPEVDFEAGTVTILDPEGWADQSDPRKGESEDA